MTRTEETIVQPIESNVPEIPAKGNGISFAHFIDLLRREEDFFRAEQHKTKIMFSRLRKIFYDNWGWNTELIRGASKIEGRYEVTVVDDPTPQTNKKPRAGSRLQTSNYDIVYKHREVKVKQGDWLNPGDAGKTPEIYANDNQDVHLPEELYCDLGHVLAGVDAYNFFAPVTPLPNCLTWARKLFPYVDSNVDIVTWLGDIASSSGEFLFQNLRKKRPLTDEEKQDIINEYATASDMLGDIDPYIIVNYYNTLAPVGQRVTDILQDYYQGGTDSSFFRQHRYSYFCDIIGLKGWDGQAFANEDEWMKYYRRQLRNNITFQVFSLTEQKIKSVWLPLWIWFGFYDKVLEMDTLLTIFVDALKKEIKNEAKYV